MERFKHIFKKLETHLNDSLLSKKLSDLPVQRVKDVKTLRKKLPLKYQLEFDDYIKFYTTNSYKSTFVNDEILKVIAEKRKIKNLVKKNVNLQILTEFIPDLYMVGGCVRDIINGVQPKDVDLCTSLSYDEVHEYTKSLHSKDVGKQFLVNIVEVNGTQYEIATFRSDKSNTGDTQCGDIMSDAQCR